MHKSTYIFIFFLLLFASLMRDLQSQVHEAADSIFNVLDKNPSDSSSFNELDHIINSLYYEDTDLAMSIAEQELLYAEKAGNKNAQGKAILNIGIIYDLKAKYDSALAMYDKALELATINELIPLQGDIYNNISITQAVLGNLEESISCALKALGIFENINDSSRMARIYNNLGARYSELEYVDRALQYYQKAAAINIVLKDNRKLAFNYGNIGLLYYDQFQNEEALEYFQKSIQLQDTLHDKYNLSIGLHNLAIAYQRLKQFDKALYHEKRAYILADELHDELGKITSLKGLAAIHKDMGKKQEALNYFLQSETLAEQLGARYYLINVYENISELYADFGDFQNAFAYNQKFNALNDSIMTTEKDKAFQKIKDFEDEKKQQEIQLLTKDSVNITVAISK